MSLLLFTYFSSLPVAVFPSEIPAKMCVSHFFTLAHASRNH